MQLRFLLLLFFVFVCFCFHQITRAYLQSTHHSQHHSRHHIEHTLHQQRSKLKLMVNSRLQIRFGLLGWLVVFFVGLHKLVRTSICSKLMPVVEPTTHLVHRSLRPNSCWQSVQTTVTIAIFRLSILHAILSATRNINVTRNRYLQAALSLSLSLSLW